MPELRRRLPGKLLVCAGPNQLPPHYGGGAQVLTRLLSPIDPSDYILASFGEGEGFGRIMPLLEGRHYRLDGGNWPPVFDPTYRLNATRARRVFIAETARWARMLARLIRHERCTTVMVTSTGGPEFVAAFLAARVMGVAWVPYLFDDWHELVATRHRALAAGAAWIEPHILRHADAVLIISPLLAAEIERDYGIRTDVLSHMVPAIAWSGGRPPKPRPWPAKPDEIRIVYTGTVYAAHWDAFATLLRALELPGLERVTVHIYSSSTAAQLEARGIVGRLVTHEPVGASELIDIQRSADILFMPLGFKTPYPEIVRTAQPTKAAEYLASGRPILAIAPPGSYLASVALEHGAAALVSEPDPAAVAKVVQNLIDDAAYRQRLVDAAWLTATRLHSPDDTFRHFCDVLDRVAQSPRRRADVRS